MGRMGRAGRSLGTIMMIGLTLSACATRQGGVSLNDPANAGSPTEVARRCEDFAKSFGYAEKSVGGRLAASALLTPLMIGVGLAGTLTGDIRGLVLATAGPVQMGRWTAKASKDNQEQRGSLRRACQEGGGPDTEVAARAVLSLAQVREHERSNRDAVRLYRDTLGILDRAGSGESEDAATAALAVAALIEKSTPTDPEIGPFYERALRIREATNDAQSGDRVSLLMRYARWLRSTGRIGEAEVLSTRADALIREAQAGEARARAASSTDVVVGENCSPASVNALDQLNQDAAAEGRTGRVLAVDCDPAGQIGAVRLATPTGAIDTLTFDTHESDPAGTIRAALFTTAP
jgi:hypothetical protein